MGHARQRILLVDDDPGIMVAVKQALTTHGYEMTTATDGLEALAAFERELPELILLDLVMPRCSGLEVCQRIRELAATPIIILSVKGSEADIVSVLDLGLTTTWSSLSAWPNYWPECGLCCVGGARSRQLRSPVVI